MPPQQTRLTSEPGLGAAELGFDFALASAEDALPEQQAAAPPAPSTWIVLRWFERLWRAFLERRRRNRSRMGLSGLSDRQLIDVGLTPGDIDRIMAQRAYDGLKDGTAYPWLSRGVM